jgi:guanylate kinase
VPLVKKGKIIILSGPSGSGKTTLYKKLLASPRLKGRLVKSISVTTRDPRPGEKHGRDYFFVSQKMFQHKIKAKHFLENENVFGNYYGTPRKNIDYILRKGKNVLLCIDVKGAKTVTRQIKGAATVFIKTPSLSILKKRLFGRGSEKKDDLNRRLKVAVDELKEAVNYQYVIVNDDLSSACRELEDLILSIII